MVQGHVEVRPGLAYGQRSGQELVFDYYRPEQSCGAAVLFVNSGGFESGQLVQYEAVASDAWRFLGPDALAIGGSGPIPLLGQFSFDRLLGAGFSVFDVRHSNVPHTFDEMLEDVRHAVLHIHDRAAEFEIDAEHLGIFGASSGGYLAIAAGLTTMQGGRRLVRAIATYYPAGFDFPADVAAFPEIRDALPALATPEEVLEANSLKNLYPSGGSPTLIIYGDQDMPFILNPCKSILSEFPKAGIEVKGIVIEGAGHEFNREDGYRTEDGERAKQEVAAWFEAKLL